MRRAALYMRSRQLQKSSATGPARSVRPTITRWKAWLCALTRPGTTAPPSRVAPRWASAGALACTDCHRPSGATVSSTSCAQAPFTQAMGATKAAV